MFRAEISGTHLKILFQFPGHTEANGEDGRDGLVDPVLNKESDLLISDMASVRNGLKCSL